MNSFMKKHNLLSILIILAILSTSIPTMSFASTSPSDISDHWAKDAIENWVNSGYIKGYPDGTFKPDNNISRAEFITLANNAYGFTAKVTIDYTDVAEGSWYADSISIAKAAGYISGYPDGTMKPNNPITRQEAAVIIAKLDKLVSDQASTEKFTDSADIPSWSKGAIGAGVKANIFTGYPDGSFKGDNFILRGESVVSLDKAKAYKSAPVSVTTTITGITTSGFGLALSPAVEELTRENVALSQDNNNITVEAITTEDNGASYTLKATLEEGKTYTLNIEKEGFNFGEAKTITILTAEQIAEPVNAQITSLPAIQNLTLTDAALVNDAKVAFDALTSTQQDFVTNENKTKLNDAVAKITELKTAVDQATADLVTEKIVNLPNAVDLTLHNATAVNETNDAFNALTASQKALVTTENQTKLNDAVAKITELQSTTN